MQRDTTSLTLPRLAGYNRMFKEEKEIEEPKSGPNILHLIAYGIKANNSSIKLRDLN